MFKIQSLPLLLSEVFPGCFSGKSKTGSLNWGYHTYLGSDITRNGLNDHMYPFHLLPIHFLGGGSDLSFLQSRDGDSSLGNQINQEERPCSTDLRGSSTNSLFRYSIIKEFLNWQAPSTCAELPINIFVLLIYE